MKSADIPFEMTSRASLLEKKANRVSQLLLVLAILLTILIAPRLENSFQTVYSNFKLYKIQNTLREEISIVQSALQTAASQKERALQLTIQSSNDRLIYSMTNFYHGRNYPRISVLIKPNGYNDIVTQINTYPSNATLASLFEELSNKELLALLEPTLHKALRVMDSRPYSFSVPDIRVASTTIPYKWVPYIILCLALYARGLINELIKDIDSFVNRCREYDSVDNEKFFSREFIPLIVPRIDEWLKAPFTFRFTSLILLTAYLFVFASDNIFIDLYESSSPIRVSLYGSWRIILRASLSITSVILVGKSLHTLSDTINLYVDRKPDESLEA